MPTLIQARINHAVGWAALKFPYSPPTMAIVKAHPGSRWIDPTRVDFKDDEISALLKHAFPDEKAWFVPASLLPLLQEDSRLKITVADYDEPRTTPPLDFFVEKLKPYQQIGLSECLRRPGFMLTYEPRVGKTPTAIAAACSMLDVGVVDLAIVLYPNTVVGEWERQLDEWAGVKLERLTSFDPLLAMEVHSLRERQFLFLGCHYEILGQREKCLARVVDGRRYVLIADEIQQCKNRKSARYRTARRLALGAPILVEGDVPDLDTYAAATCYSRIALSGTEMRNRPRDLFGPLDLTLPGQVGFYWKGYAKAFCDAHKDEHGHWNDKGKSQPELLRKRLQLVSQKVTRAEAAPWLPKLDRKTILCAVPEATLKKYRKLEAAYGPRLAKALENDELSAENKTLLEELDRETSSAKMDEAIRQCLLALDRGVKVRLSAHHHDTVKTFVERFDSYFDEDHALRAYPMHVAAGYMSQADREEAMGRWRAVAGPALLVTNTLSTNVGIDLSEAAVSIALEVEWVPSDQEQWELRAMDVHLGKTVEPPLIIYLLVRGTIDEAKVRACLLKLRDIEQIVGSGTDTGAMGAAFRASGVVRDRDLGLAGANRSVMADAIREMRERILRGPDTREASLEAEMGAWEDDETNEDED